MLPGSPFLSKCQALSAIRPRSPQWYQTGVLSDSISFLEIGRGHRVSNQGSTVGGMWKSFCVSPETAGSGRGVRRGVVMVRHPGLFLPKFGATSWHVFTQSLQIVAVEPRIHLLACWERCFALPQPLYKWRHQSGIFWIPCRNKI
jgi:hypothetical protein